MEITETSLNDLKQQGINIADPSSLNDFIRCHYYYKCRHEDGLTPVTAPPEHGLQFGIAIHEALAFWFKHNKQSIYDKPALELFTKLFQPHEEQPTFNKKTGREIAATYTVVYGASLLLFYFQQYRNDPRRIVGVELPLCEELTTGIYLAGRIDLLLEDKSGYVVVDHKTTKYPDRYLMNPNLQFMTYIFMVAKLQGISFTQAMMELDLLVVSKSRSPHELLARTPITYSKAQMLAYQESVTQHMTELQRCRLTGEWPQSWRCMEYFRRCPYLPLCTTTTKDAIPQLRQTAYRVSYWNPLQVGQGG